MTAGIQCGNSWAFVGGPSQGRGEAVGGGGASPVCRVDSCRIRFVPDEDAP